MKYYISFIISALIIINSSLAGGKMLAPMQMHDIEQIFLDANQKQLREICELSESVSVPSFSPPIKQYLGLDQYSKKELENALQWILASPLALHEKTWEYLREVALHPCGAMILRDAIAVCRNIEDPEELNIRYPYGLAGMAACLGKYVDPQEVFYPFTLDESERIKMNMILTLRMPTQQEIAAHMEYLKKDGVSDKKPDERLAEVMTKENILAEKTEIDFNVLIFDVYVQELVKVISKYKYLSELLKNSENRDDTLVRNSSIFIADYNCSENPPEIAELFKLSFKVKYDFLDAKKLVFIFLSLLFQAVHIVSTMPVYIKVKREIAYSRVIDYIIKMIQLNNNINDPQACKSIVEELHALNPHIAKTRIYPIQFSRFLEKSY